MTPAINDPLLDSLRGLPRATPSSRSTRQTRAHAHALLAAARRRQDRAKADAERSLPARALDAGFAVVCVVYLSGTVAQALRLLAALR
jgi:hypothetical protein